MADGVVLPIVVIGGLKRGSEERGAGEFMLLPKINMGEFVSC